MKKKVVLIIMDGWGHGQHPASDAIYQSHTPFVKSLYSKYTNTELKTHGEAVGLPEDQMGNSEVGHLNIGAGRIVYQELQRINNAISSGQLAKNKTLLDTFNYCKQFNKPIHLIGLVSEGGVHSSLGHVKALASIANDNGLKNVFIHAFTDGRDCDPKSGLSFLADLENHLNKTVGKIVSIVGRYYAMDRDNRWERVKVAYDLLVNKAGEKFNTISDAIQASYKNDITDEFIKPVLIGDGNTIQESRIKNGDAVLCFNFRTDRCREITKALTQQDFPDQQMQKLDLHYTTMTIYDHKYVGVNTIFQNQDLNFTLGEVLEKNNLNQIRIAETEKYPHVTFFFSGGREKEFTNEKRIMIPSPKVATYDLKPEMSAIEVKDALLPELQSQWPHFVCLNFANPDMVGHTGVFSAVQKAVETVDECVKQVVETAIENGYEVFLTADHGNADYVINEDGSPNTAHTKNPVPLFYISRNSDSILKKGKLGDLAPTILKVMGIDVPEQMTGENLLQS